MKEMARWLVWSGAILVLTGLVLGGLGKIPGLGRLPGDLYFKRGQFSFYFPLATSLLVSLVVTVLWNLFKKGSS